MKYALILLMLSVFACNSNSPNVKQELPTEEKTPSLEKATVVSYQNLNVSDFKKAIDNKKNAVILDVRTSEETSEGKIEGAVELDYYGPDFAEKLFQMDKNKEYYVYCKVGGRSAKAARLMINNGFTKVYNLEGGFTAWEEDNK